MNRTANLMHCILGSLHGGGLCVDSAPSAGQRTSYWMFFDRRYHLVSVIFESIVRSQGRDIINNNGQKKTTKKDGLCAAIALLAIISFVMKHITVLGEKKISPLRIQCSASSTHRLRTFHLLKSRWGVIVLVPSNVWLWKKSILRCREKLNIRRFSRSHGTRMNDPGMRNFVHVKIVCCWNRAKANRISKSHGMLDWTWVPIVLLKTYMKKKTTPASVRLTHFSDFSYHSFQCNILCRKYAQN